MEKGRLFPAVASYQKPDGGLCAPFPGRGVCGGDGATAAAAKAEEVASGADRKAPRPRRSKKRSHVHGGWKLSTEDVAEVASTEAEGMAEVMSMADEDADEVASTVAKGVAEVVSTVAEGADEITSKTASGVDEVTSTTVEGADKIAAEGVDEVMSTTAEGLDEVAS